MVELDYQIEEDEIWKKVNYEVFRSFRGHRKLNGHPYYGAVYIFGTEIQVVTAHQAYEDYIRENRHESKLG